MPAFDTGGLLGVGGGGTSSTVISTVSAKLLSVPSLTISWKVRSVWLLTRGAVNDGLDAVVLDNVTVGTPIDQEYVMRSLSGLKIVYHPE